MERFRYQDLGEEFKGHTEVEDLKTFVDFLGLEPSGEQMTKLTGLQPSVLKDVFEGRTQESERRTHSAILGKFARTSSEAIAELVGKLTLGEAGIKWLENAQVRTSQGLMRPIEALSDSFLALEAEAQVQTFLQMP